MNRLISKLERIGQNVKHTAKAAGLTYTEDRTKGFYRKKSGKGFKFLTYDGLLVKDKELLSRFNKLVIPPAYDDVWISPAENTHLQFTGYDAKGRKQYRYHQGWNAIRNQAKFFRMRNFANALPKIRKQVEQDLARRGLPFEKVIALVIKLMDLTHIRIGNDSYSKLYGSYGLTTLKDRHVKFSGNEVKFAFKGKKGVYHEIALESKRLANLVKQCQDIPGKELFQYYDEDGKHYSIGSGDVNTYLKEVTGEDFTAKDFRTWAGSVHALCELKKICHEDAVSDHKKSVIKVIDEVSKKLGNTRTVCKKYYIHPSVITAFENGNLTKYKVRANARHLLSDEERLLVHLLEKEGLAQVIKN